MDLSANMKKRSIKKKNKEVSELEADSYLEAPNTEREVVSAYHNKY